MQLWQKRNKKKKKTIAQKHDLKIFQRKRGFSLKKNIRQVHTYSQKYWELSCKI